MTTSPIDNYNELGLANLLEKYQQLPGWTGLMNMLMKQVQEIEDMLNTFPEGRALATAIGQQLDELGTIVVQDREGFDDDFYRVLLYVKIGINTSEGEPLKIIDIFKLLTEAATVHYQNLGNGNLSLASDGQSPIEDIEFLFENMEKVIAAGCRLTHISFYDPDEPFSFDGNNPNAPGLGFSDITNTLGGKFASLERNKVPFAFAGENESYEGFGSLIDPVSGGVFISLEEYVGEC